MSAICISLRQLVASPHRDFTLQTDNLDLDPGQHCLLTGANGGGKSALLAVLAGEIIPRQGTCEVSGTLEWVSSYQQQALLEQERKKDSADILDVIAVPTLAGEILLDASQHVSGCDKHDELSGQVRRITDALCITDVLKRPFTALSTGETRKLLLARALLRQPDWLLLDEPFNGLDEKTTHALQQLLVEIAPHTTLVVATARWQDLPAGLFCHCGWMENGRLGALTVTRTTDELNDHLSRLFSLSADDLALPAAPDNRVEPAAGALVTLTNGIVRFDEHTVFEGLNWQVNPAEHWQIVGPNGAGKSVLLAMITGDDPHCYTNQLTVFGYKRGSGESIWDIKQHIGLVSNSLYLQYRVNCSVRHALLSGFFDSIGLYQQPDRQQQIIADQWLTLLQLSEQAQTPLQSLSEGDRRLVLIARAMIKQPALLILDEPCNGLDPLNRAKVLALTSRLMAQSTTTVLYVNHHREDTLNSKTSVLDLSDYQAG